jgi:GNAT superfamily N-acetyltransferase
LAAPINPVLQHLSSRNQDAISGLLRGSDRSAASDPASPDVRWMAGVYLADELTSLVRLRDGSLEGQVETTLFVDAKWRRQGIGTLLLEAAMDWALQHQASALRLVCARTDWPMRRLAEKFGARLDLVLGQIVADIPIGQLPPEQRAPSPDSGIAEPAAKEARRRCS